jgi:acyl-CoA synthetase (AMP-forming)/AMP-acid ligase II
MGLSFQQFKAQAPEQQFNTIIENLDKLGTGGERNAALVALFGKGVAGTVAGMVDNYKKLASQAVVASDEQIQALDNASDAWDRFVKNTESRVTQLLGSFVLLAADSKKHLQTQIQYLQLAANGMVPYINGVAGARAELEQMRAGMPELFAHWKQDIDITDKASASQRSLTEELRARAGGARRPLR